MNVSSWLIWGFAATVVLSTLLAGGHGFGLTRMSMPYLMGTMVTPDRRRAHFWGMLIHLANGWIFALVYVAAFHHWGGPSIWKGVAIGAVHAAFVLTAGMGAMPALHPRMASEQHGPDTARPLEPPGFLALHYGVRTPIAALLAHLVYGGILGAFYEMP